MTSFNPMTFDLTTFEQAFSARPVVSVRSRLFVLLDDLKPALGMQWLRAVDVTTLLTTAGTPQQEGTTVPVWYDGSAVCYVRHRSKKPHQLPVIDLPLWVGVGTGGLGGQLAAA
jgi:hypothetical protein